MTWSPVLRHREDKGRGQEFHPGCSWPLFPAHRLSGYTCQKSPHRNLTSALSFHARGRRQECNYHRDNPEFVLISKKYTYKSLLFSHQRTSHLIESPSCQLKQSQVLQEKAAAESHLCAMHFSLQLCFQ